MQYSKADYSAGELSPSLHCRPEFPVFAAGAKVMKNALPLPTGGWCNRPGTRAVAHAKAGGTKWRLVSFVFSTGDAFVLEFSNLCIRFFKGYAVVGAPYEVVTPWASADLAALKFTQSADVIFITNGTRQPQILTRLSDTSWTLTAYMYKNGPYMLENAVDTTITPSAVTSGSKIITGVTKANPGVVTSVAHGFADGDIVYLSGIGGMVELNELPFKVRNKAADTFELDYNGAGASLDTSGYTAYTSGGTAQKCVRLTATAGSAPFSNVTGYKHSTGRALWKINHWIQSQVVAAAYSAPGTGTAIKCGGTWRIVTHGTWTGTVRIQVSEDNATWTDSRIFLGVSDKNWDTYVTETFSTQFYVRVNVTAMSAGSCQVDLTSDPFEWSGYVRTVQVPTGGGGASENHDTADALVIDTLGNTTATKVWAEGSWSDYRGYPTCSTFYQDRLCFAGSRTEADTVWLSKAGNYYDFGTSFPIQSDDGISVRIPSLEFNRIHNLVPLNNLIAMTSSALFSVGAGGTTGVLSPNNVNIKANDLAGSGAMTPVIINDRIVYAQTFNKIIRDTGYNFETEGFQGINLSLFSEHLFKTSAAVEMAYQREPWQTLWIVRADGKLCSLTYIKQTETYGWAVHSTSQGYYVAPEIDDIRKDNGKFLSVCAVPGTAQDDIWVIVERDTYVGGIKRTIEYFSNRNASNDPRKQVFLDCSYEYDDPKAVTDIVPATPGLVSSSAHGFSNNDLVEIDVITYHRAHYAMNGMRFMIKNATADTFELYDSETGLIPYSTEIFGNWETTQGMVRKCITTMTGLTCLNGIKPTFLKNGIAKTADSNVSGGSVSILGAASLVQAGIPYYTDVEPMDMEFQTTTGGTPGKKKSVSEVSVSLFETYGGKIGTVRNITKENGAIECAVNPDMKEMTDNNGGLLRHVTTAGLYTGVPPALFTGAYNQSVMSGSRNPLSLIIRQEDPYPITVLAVNADVEIAE